MNAKTTHLSKKMRFPLALATSVGTVLLGSLSALLFGSSKGYAGLNMPPLAPPDLAFMIIWPILYFMIGLSLFFIISTPTFTPEKIAPKKSATWLWIAQMVFNVCWPLAFFTFQLYAFSFVWICLLIAINMVLIINCFKFSKTAAWLLIPYQLWLLFAAYLNLFIAILN